MTWQVYCVLFCVLHLLCAACSLVGGTFRSCSHGTWSHRRLEAGAVCEPSRCVCVCVCVCVPA